LEALKDEDKPMDVDRARAIAEVADKIIDSAKVEVRFAEAVGELPSADFFDSPKPARPALVAGGPEPRR
jgi:hypothetical protein